MLLGAMPALSIDPQFSANARQKLETLMSSTQDDRRKEVVIPQDGNRAATQRFNTRKSIFGTPAGRAQSRGLRIIG